MKKTLKKEAGINKRLFDGRVAILTEDVKAKLAIEIVKRVEGYIKSAVIDGAGGMGGMYPEEIEKEAREAVEADKEQLSFVLEKVTEQLAADFMERSEMAETIR